MFDLEIIAKKDISWKFLLFKPLLLLYKVLVTNKGLQDIWN